MQEAQEVATLVQPSAAQGRIAHHLGHHGEDLPRAEVEPSIERLHRREDLRSRQTGIAERARLHAEAETQATALLIDGRARLDVEMAELEARAETDIAAAAGRSTDELRAAIARHSSVAVDRIVADTLDDATHQALIEGFIQRVGASTGASA